MMDARITVEPRNTPEKVHSSMIGETRFAVIARHVDFFSTPVSSGYFGTKKQNFDEIVNFCNKNKIDIIHSHHPF